MRDPCARDPCAAKPPPERISLGLSTLLNGRHRLVELTGAEVFLDRAGSRRRGVDRRHAHERAGQADMEPVINAGAAPRLWRIYICNSLIKT